MKCSTYQSYIDETISPSFIFYSTLLRNLCFGKNKFTVIDWSYFREFRLNNSSFLMLQNFLRPGNTINIEKELTSRR